MPAELSDDELLEMAERDGHFSFLEGAAEDIYTWDDGEEVEEGRSITCRGVMTPRPQ